MSTFRSKACIGGIRFPFGLCHVLKFQRQARALPRAANDNAGLWSLRQPECIADESRI